ncbi:MAG: hypothetical protein ABJA02_08125 [Acidobacteriota bacterium]
MIKTFKKTNSRTAAVITWVFVVLMFGLTAMAQTEQEKSAELPTRIRSAATVSGNTGGESHDSYVVTARKGQTLKVQISWQTEDTNKAQFVVSRSPDFFAGDLVEGGRETYDGKNWAGKVAKTGDYYIYVTAHPQANYKLKVTVK